MCHPVNKTIVEGYILYIIQITVAFWGLVCNAALLRDHLSTTQQASLFCSWTHELSHHRGDISKELQRSRYGTLSFPCTPNCLQHLFAKSLVKTTGECCKKGSPELRSMTPDSSHSASLLCLNHKSSLFCFHSRHTTAFCTHWHSCSGYRTVQQPSPRLS